MSDLSGTAADIVAILHAISRLLTWAFKSFSKESTTSVVSRDTQRRRAELQKALDALAAAMAALLDLNDPDIGHIEDLLATAEKGGVPEHKIRPVRWMLERYRLSRLRRSASVATYKLAPVQKTSRYSAKKSAKGKPIRKRVVFGKKSTRVHSKKVGKKATMKKRTPR